MGSVSKQIRVMVVDDHPLMRAGLAGEINAQADMCVVSEAANGDEAIANFRLHRPDVTLMDLRMPKLGGIEAIEAIRSQYPKSRIVVLTTASGDVQVLRAIRAGAVGYLLKNVLRTELTDTVRLVHAGRRRIPPDIAQEVAEHALDDEVSERETTVLKHIARGRSNKIIADELGISENTVKNHVKSLLAKLGASDRTHAVTLALKRGLLDPVDTMVLE